MTNPKASTSEVYRPKVLFLASECNPLWHSLPALVYEYFIALSKYADLTLVTHIRNLENLESALPKDIKAIYIDTEVISKPFYKLSTFLTGDPDKAMTLQVALSYPGNIYFEYCVWKMFKTQLKKGDFDIVHRASPMSPTIPSPMAKWSPIPFVIGPVLGGLPWPKQFQGEMQREGEWMNYVRVLHRLMPYYQSTYKRAAVILAGYGHTVGDIPIKNNDRVIEFSEGGIHRHHYPEAEKQTHTRRRILFVGRLVPFKQPELLVRCFINNPALREHELIIVGNGPEYPRIETLIKEHKLGNCVTLTGTIPHAEVREQMYQADIFAFPSIREQGGGVITMASMASTPCMVVDYGGPSVRVPENGGVKVALGDYDQLVSRFSHELESLAGDPERCKAMGIVAREFTKKYYCWDWKARKTREIYRWVLGKNETKPSFWSDIEDE